MTHAYIGVDLSKDWLDIHHPKTGHARIENQDAAIRQWIASLAATDIVVFEATSGCDALLLRLLAERDQPGARVNPLYAWHFAQSLNLAKTDRVDAAMQARMGAERQLPPGLAYDAARVELGELAGRRDQLKRMETQEKNRLTKAYSSVVRTDIRASLAGLTRRIARIEAAIADHLRAHPELAESAQLLRSIPGIGAVASITLLAAMPELGTCDRRAIASLGGLAPKARESGKWRGRRSIGAGRRNVRRALYMAALSVLRHGTLASRLIHRMRAEGRPGKIIAIAVARKILTIANAVLRDRAPFKAA